uniref:basic proline-rich protein-like n=1 Tax=Odobenus rosmarus divergens TaxID=9708 RepID=UPI00063CB9FF|nr:PREDICTED: basic proline-rich protein-like [Odobenus rosmarus divergens]
MWSTRRRKPGSTARQARPAPGRPRSPLPRSTAPRARRGPGRPARRAGRADGAEGGSRNASQPPCAAGRWLCNPLRGGPPWAGHPRRQPRLPAGPAPRARPPAPRPAPRSPAPRVEAHGPAAQAARTRPRAPARPLPPFPYLRRAGGRPPRLLSAGVARPRASSSRAGRSQHLPGDTAATGRARTPPRCGRHTSSLRPRPRRPPQTHSPGGASAGCRSAHRSATPTPPLPAPRFRVLLPTTVPPTVNPRRACFKHSPGPTDPAL